VSGELHALAALPLYPLVRRLGRPIAGLDDMEKLKFLTLSGLELQPVASRSAECAVPVPAKMIVAKPIRIQVKMKIGVAVEGSYSFTSNGRFETSCLGSDVSFYFFVVLSMLFFFCSFGADTLQPP
jgi:hypothetical protein